MGRAPPGRAGFAPPLLDHRRQINKAADDATAAIRTVEGLLRDLNLGIDGWHTYDTETHSKGAETRHGLVYARVKGDFRIGVQAVCHQIAKGDHAVPEQCQSEDGVILWDNCARDVKIRAFTALPDLLSDILKKAERTLEDTKATAKAVSKVLAATTPGEAKPKKKAPRHEGKSLETQQNPVEGSENQVPPVKTTAGPKHKK